VNQTTVLIAGNAPTTPRDSRFWIRARSFGDGGDELERGCALPWCRKKKHNADLPLFYISDMGVQLQDSEWRMKDEKSIAPYGDRAFEFSTNSGTADIPANSRKKFSVDNKINAEARFQSRLPILEVPETIHIAHFRVPVKIGSGPTSQDTVPPIYRLELSCFHFCRRPQLMANTVSVALLIKTQVH
jgi:hypothetical protein